MNFLADPLTVYLTLSAVVIATLSLFLTVRIQQVRTQRRLLDRCRDLEKEIASFRSLAMQATQPAASPHPAGVAAPEVSEDILNPAKRDRALALCESGQSAGRIAAGLGLPRNQVELLLKVGRAAKAA